MGFREDFRDKVLFLLDVKGIYNIKMIYDF